MFKRVLGLLLTSFTIFSIYFLSYPTETTPAIGSFLSPTNGFWSNIELRNLKQNSIVLNGPREKVNIYIDNRRVPHIFAKNDEDLYFAQGYMVAKERLWQMDFISYAAAGRISELIGDKALDFDRYNRRIGMLSAAKKTVELTEKDPATKLIVDNYTAGVNYYIEHLAQKNLPLEYKLIGYTPEKWTPLKCALLLKYMANDLTGTDNDLQNTNAINQFGRVAFDKMFPDFPQLQSPIIPVGTNFTSKTPSNQPTNSIISKGNFKNPFEEFNPPKGLGSNNWTLSGSKTASGKPLLCNDPHLVLSLPSIWYEIQLHAPGINAYGVTLPGSPGIVIGFNENISWGVTNGTMDVRDWFSINYENSKKNSYKVGDKYLPITYEIQNFKIKGKESISDTVRNTIVGPIIYDEKLKGIKDHQHLAMHWEAANASNELKCFYLLNRAKEHKDYLNALNYYGCPGQNFVYADRFNNIAIKEQGRFPLRQKEGGKFVTPLENFDLTQLNKYIPFENNPYILNPLRGFCSSANQHPTDNAYPYYYSGDYEKYRNRRINYVLESLNKATPKDMQTLQNDNFSLLAAETLPFLLSNIVDSTLNPQQKKILSELKNWNFITDFNLKTPSYFYKWWSELLKITWDEFAQNNTTMRIPDDFQTSWILRNEPNFELMDNKKTPKIETVSDLSNISFNIMTDYFLKLPKEAKNADWQFQKGTTISHLAKLNSFSILNVPIGGYASIVNATTDVWGPSWRMVVDFKNGRPEAYGVFPGGQSGNPGSQSYADMVSDWANGKYNILQFWTNEEMAKKNYKLEKK